MGGVSLKALIEVRRRFSRIGWRIGSVKIILSAWSISSSTNWTFQASASPARLRHARVDLDIIQLFCSSCSSRQDPLVMSLDCRA